MELFNELNPEQRSAVDTLEGPLLVLAGAGSGKTRVVTCRIVNLLEHGVLASKILGVTFTNKAAQEMKERVRNLTQAEVLICTFHSLGVRILRESIHHLGYTRNFIIYDEDDSEKLLKQCLLIFAETHGKLDLKIVRGLISKAKNNLQMPEDIDIASSTTPVEQLIPQIYKMYQDKLQEYNALDYDDLLFLTVRLFTEYPSILEYYQQRWSHLLIDEYQDTNAVQYAMVNHLVAKHGNLCVVGDPDQSIYSWRGANINNILNFENDYPGAKVVRLDQNYRSRCNILNAANAVIKNNRHRYDKHLWSDRGSGDKIKHYRGDNERSEAAFIAERIAHHHQKDAIPLSQMVVFYRTNAQSRVFEDCFLQTHIPYVIVGGVSFYQRREIKDILAWLRMVQSGADFIAFSRTINIPKRGLGDAALEKVRSAAAQENHTIFSFCEQLVDGLLQVPLKLSVRQKEGIKEYVDIIRQLRVMSRDQPLSELVKTTIELTRYQEYLLEDPETAEDRSENLGALVVKACEWEDGAAEKTLESFLEELSLKSSLDEADTSKEHVSLMTIHNGKGLEFAVAFLAGMEEDLFPHINVRESQEGIEEERRLCYVGMTRAKEWLYVTDVSARSIWGVTRTQRPSRFIREIPGEYIEKASRSVGGVKTAKAPRPVVQVKDDSDFIDDMNQAQEAEEMQPFSIGEVIFHKAFGIGHVKNVYKGSAGLTYQIFFTKDQLEKNIVAKYAQLTRL